MPKKALLIIDHGSKVASANESLLEIVEHLRKKRPDYIIEMAHMELAEPSIETGLQNCLKEGATEITAIPYLLANGRHAKTDIPNIVNDFKKDHPSIKITTTAALGPDPLLAQLILDKHQL